MGIRHAGIQGIASIPSDPPLGVAVRADLTKHAEAITIAVLASVNGRNAREAILTACAALFDAGAEAMRDAAANISASYEPGVNPADHEECDWFGGACEAAEKIEKSIRDIDPASLREAK